MYSTCQLVLITTFFGATVTALQWATSEWSDCQIVAGACGPHTPSVPVYGHKKRDVWCSSSQNGSVIPDKFCRSERRPHSSIVCFGHCPRCHGSWSSWSPLRCQECVGRQRRQLECHQGDPKVIEEHRACFSPALCKLSSSQASILLPSEVITQPAISQPSTALRPPEPLTAPFVPYLHVGAWSECQPQQEKEDEEPMEPRRQKKRKKRKNRKVPHRSKRNNFPVVPAELKEEERVKSWSPRLPSDLEISFVANSVPEPRHGVQTREVQCRGQDGETLPFRVCVDGHSQTVVPTTVRTCVTSQSCSTSAWSEWTLDKNPECQGWEKKVKRMVRNRQIIKLPTGYGGPCPHLTEHKPLMETNVTCTPKYTLVASAWSPCQVQDMNGNPAICGGGLQDRNISCLKTEGQNPVDLRLCSSLTQLTRVQRCFLPCTDSCRVGPWSEWSECIPKDCSALQAPPHLPGRQTRERRPLQYSSLSSCPHLEESRDCSISSCYRWRLEKRDECFLPRGQQPCGMGSRKVLYACVDYAGKPSPVEACSRLEKPPYQEECHILCPQSCILSSWSEWSPCQNSCSSRLLSSRAALPSFRNRSLLALGEMTNGNGGGCHELSEVRMCPATTECDTFHWRVGLWSTCLVLNKTSNCGPGTKTRTAICVMDNEVSDIRGRVVPDWRCHGLQLKPPTEESCHKDCPQNCQLTQWSEWSACEDRQCHLDHPSQQPLASAGSSLTTTSTMPSFTVIMNTQSRYRQVLQWPRHGGLECSRLIDVRPCPLQSSHSSCQSPVWRPLSWSSCLLPHGKSCGEGIRVRSLDCLSAGLARVDMKECLEDRRLMERPLPLQHERCWVNCLNQCETGPWSPWSACSSTCPSSRTRTRLTNDVKCQEDHPNVETESCSCQSYRSVPNGDWSDCLIIEESQEGKSSVSPFCGIGKRYRRLDCLDMSNQLAEPILCGLGNDGNSNKSSFYQSEDCIVSCPTDCLMSPWTEWGLCDTICGHGLKNRTSKVLRLASVGGRPCPGPSVQYDICSYPCDNFYWTVSAWSQCSSLFEQKSSPVGKCGRGRKTRTIRCVEKTSDGLELDVPSHFCDPEEKPMAERDCRIHCPGECVHSEWTEWSSCHSDECVESGVQKRNRTLLRTSSSGQKCSESTNRESRACAEACFFRYEWSLTAWSSCQPVGDSSCGEGRRRRGVKCTRLRDGRSVKESLCPAKDRPKELETWCPTDCPVDCEVSPWTHWDLSSCKCGRQASQMTRKRFVSTEASPSGRPCPPVMEETKPCPSRPCYQLMESSSFCDLQGASCGVGTMRHNLTCLRVGTALTDSSSEDMSRCQERPFGSYSDDVCFISCPTDCVLSDWTSWSECQGPCVGTKTSGTRTRRREVKRTAVRPHGQCLSELVQRQPCLLDPCYTYTNMVNNGEKEAICIRSDGLIVEDHFCQGGYPSRQPYFEANQECQPACRVLNSQCGPDFKCHCRQGFHPTYLPAPILSSREPTLVFCQSLADLLLHNHSTANVSKGLDNMSPTDSNGTLIDVPKSYYPQDTELNPWMLAMIGIGCVFIAFVGVSIYLMCKSTNQEVSRVPKD